jgi:manganese/iron transport system permease protein
MSAALDWIVLPLSYPFMQRALIVALLVGAVCAVLSCYLVLKGWSLMGDAISHAVLPGIVIAYVLGLPLALGAFAAGLFCGVFTGYLKENSRIKEDTVMGIVFSGMFGFGLVLFTKIETDQHLNHILFGNVLGVSVRDLVETAIIAGGTLLIVLVKRRDLLLYCFDPNHARAIGLPVRVLHYGLLVLLALTIVSSLKAVGIILVIAMLIAPGATAFLLTDRFDRMLLIAVVVATFSSALGTILSFHLDAATGACIVLVQAFVFILAFLFAPKRGLLASWRGQTVTPPLPPLREEKPQVLSGQASVAAGVRHSAAQDGEDQGRGPADQEHAIQRRHWREQPPLRYGKHVAVAERGVVAESEIDEIGARRSGLHRRVSQGPHQDFQEMRGDQ